MKTPKWTLTHQAAAMREGWLLTSTEAGTLEIQRHDRDPKGRFPSDAEALRHVFGWARNPKALGLPATFHTLALTLIVEREKEMARRGRARVELALT